MKIIFHSHANKTHFHNKGFVLSLVLKVRVFVTREWPIETAVTDKGHLLIRKGSLKTYSM